MILLNFLRCFAYVRDLETQVLCAKIDTVKLGVLEAQFAVSESHSAYYRECAEKAEARAQAAEHNLTEKLATAGDALALRLTGRRLFSKAPVEAPPAQDRPPINLTSGARKVFASDVAKRKSAEFFERAAKQAGVIAEDEQKPN